MIKHGASEEYVLNETQLQNLWSECKSLDDKVLVGLTAYAGLRVSEATHLDISWIRNEEIHIPSNKPCKCWECRKKGYWTPKTKASIRVIPLPGFFKPILLEYLSKRPEGMKISRQVPWHTIQRLAKQAKLPHIFPHALRATAATLYAKQGFTAVELCQMFGWGRFNIAENYIRIAEGREGAKRKMGQIFPD